MELSVSDFVTMEGGGFSSKEKVKCLQCGQEMRKIERHWKTIHPNQLNNNVKYSAIPVKGQRSLFSHGFSSAIPSQNVIQTMEVTDIQDRQETGGEKRGNDDNDYDSNSNKKLKENEETSVEMKVDEIANDVKDVKLMLENLQKSNEKKANKPRLEENSLHPIDVDQILWKCRNILNILC